MKKTFRFLGEWLEKTLLFWCADLVFQHPAIDSFDAASIRLELPAGLRIWKTGDAGLESSLTHGSRGKSTSIRLQREHKCLTTIETSALRLVTNALL